MHQYFKHNYEIPLDRFLRQKVKCDMNSIKWLHATRRLKV